MLFLCVGWWIVVAVVLSDCWCWRVLLGCFGYEYVVSTELDGVLEFEED